MAERRPVSCCATCGVTPEPAHLGDPTRRRPAGATTVRGARHRFHCRCGRCWSQAHKVALGLLNPDRGPQAAADAPLARVGYGGAGRLGGGKPGEDQRRGIPLFTRVLHQNGATIGLMWRIATWKRSVRSAILPDRTVSWRPNGASCSGALRGHNVGRCFMNCQPEGP